MTDKEKLLKEIYLRYPNHAFKTSDIFKLSCDEFIPINRRDRNKRVLVEEGLLEHITDPNKKMLHGNLGKEDSYILTQKGKTQAKGLCQLVMF